ncbi:MAG: hypothetical protein GWN18_20335 [Thermoplasmata archaeon]|nr:hypothetical protein [Thermoplasmata archaeon]NIS14472.1 hypothetical protein [Thermoplasmata archaeon]NIS22322.1 hypothetical protein [Thermoplasmata archaeon]NIT80199.1 hypothetical protein [Thermoplasmata archaeon]NIU51327.1 hypothetical protein [Thermoplasmata archaeon]
MIRKALRLIDRGSITFSEMALELGMTEADLKNRLETMVMMGHLEAVTIPGDAIDPDGHCPGCVMASTCREDVCSEGVPVVGYRLTEKGRRLARSEEEG